MTALKLQMNSMNHFEKVLHTFANATNKNIRKILDDYDACSNMTLDNVYLLPREKRNHPKQCYEDSCEGSSVLVRKLAIHYKNCRWFMQYLINLNTAHQSIHDIDVATALGDIDYLIKLLARTANKSPSVYSPDESSSNVAKNYHYHEAKFLMRCADLPDTICHSCDMLVPRKEISFPKETWINVMSPPKNTAWNKLKQFLNIEKFPN